MPFNSPTRRRFLQGSLAATLGSVAVGDALRPYGPVPTPAQQRWGELQFYNFLHFTVNTFTDKEWGYGDEDPKVFNPSAFDADAIVETLKDAGSKGILLTCKHHDGFCLWPTKTTAHSIRNSPFRNGKGDAVRELSDAARKNGLQFGVYLSPWDRNQATYGSPAYLKIYRQQMRELLTDYGPLFEIWHDGANGGDGYYGGAREKRIIDKLHYYDWERTWELEQLLQPRAVRFSDVGPDIRWVGNEKGIAGETCWATITPRAAGGAPASPGDVIESELTTGTLDGKFWMPAECDVSIRPGWFFHESENAQVKTAGQLFDLYLASTGRGASFLLNVPPDRRGLLHPADTKSLKEFGRMRRQTFAENRARPARIEALNMQLIDGKTAATSGVTDHFEKKAEVTLTLPRTAQFDLVQLREHTPLGQRVRRFAIDVWQNGNPVSFAEGTSIGLCRILSAAKPVLSDRVRLRILEADAFPVLSELSLHLSAR